MEKVGMIKDQLVERQREPEDRSEREFKSNQLEI